MPDNLIHMQHGSKSPAGFAHGGESFDSDENGIIAVPSEIAAVAKSHGFSVAEKPALKPLTKDAGGAKGGDKKLVKPGETEDAGGAKGGDGK